MKLTASVVVLCAIVLPIFADSELLGADDVDLKRAPMTTPTPGNPEPINDLHDKSEAKRMRVDMQQKKEELKSLKNQLKSSELTKAEKLAARGRFNALKQEVQSERLSLSKFAVEQAVAPEVERVGKGGKKHKGNKGDKKKSKKDGKKEKKPGKKNKLTEPVEMDEETIDEGDKTTQKLTKAQLKEQRRAERKKAKKEGKVTRLGTKPDMLKGKVIESLEMMADAPQLPVRERKPNRKNENQETKKAKKGKKHRKVCETRADCEDSEVCSANKKGKKVCYPMKRTDKRENQKCLSTVQCKRDLTCFVANNADTTKDGRKHGRCKNRSTMSEEDKQKGNFLAA